MDKYIQLQSADGLNDLFTTVKPELKYTNSSPTSGWGAGAEVVLGCTRTPKYLLVEVVQNPSSTNKYYETFIIIPEHLYTHTTARFDGGTNYNMERSFIYESSTDKFRTPAICYYGTSWNSMGGSSATFLVPTRVWAIY